MELAYHEVYMHALIFIFEYFFLLVILISALKKILPFYSLIFIFAQRQRCLRKWFENQTDPAR